MPLIITKFIAPANMDAQTYFKRWGALNKPGQQKQVIKSMSVDFNQVDLISQKLQMAGLAILANVDPVASNYVAAGICTSKQMMVGVLLRLEPNMSTNQYRLTIRTSNVEATDNLMELFDGQF